MKKKVALVIRANHFFTLLLFIICCRSYCQSAKVTVTQDFQIGQQKNYDVLRGKIDSRRPGMENIKSSTDVAFVVLSKKDKYKECSWKYGKTKMIGIDESEIDEQTNKVLNIYEGLEVKFLIDDIGAVQEITNFEECKKYIESAFKIVYETGTQKYTQEQLSKMNNALKSTYASADMLVNTYCPELSVFFNMFGETIKVDSIYLSKSELPNPFGGRSFPTDVKTKTETVENGIVKISVEQKIPKNDLNDIMKETFIELSKLSDKPFNENEVPKLNMTTTIYYTYDVTGKFLKEVYSEKIIESDDLKQTQTITVVLKN